MGWTDRSRCLYVLALFVERPDLFEKIGAFIDEIIGIWLRMCPHPCEPAPAPPQCAALGLYAVQSKPWYRAPNAAEMPEGEP